MTEEEKARMEALRQRAERVGFALRKGLGPDDGCYFLVSCEPKDLSEEERQRHRFWSLDDLEAFIAEEEARPTTPTYWRTEISASRPSNPYECDTFWVTVEMVTARRDADAQALAYEQASCFVVANCGVTVGAPTLNTPTKVQRPDRSPNGNAPDPPYCPVWIEK
jgi:hypothetical protein